MAYAVRVAYNGDGSECAAASINGEASYGEETNVGLRIFQAAKDANLEEMRALLGRPDARDYVNYTDTSGKTPLTVAVQKGCIVCIKLLIACSANLYHTIVRNGQELTMTEVAKQHSHTRVVTYLEGCIDDLVRFETTRAHIEANMISIATKPQCTAKELRTFSFLLRRLRRDCSYIVDDYDSGDIPLLLRALTSNSCLLKSPLPTVTLHKQSLSCDT